MFTLTMRIILVLLYFPFIHSQMQIEQAVSYLKKYGYMSPGSGEFRGALMKFQRYMGLPVTGVMDDICASVMKMPRCGLPDMAFSHKMTRRHKRFSVQRSRWSRNKLTYKIVRYSKKIKREVVDKEVKEAFDFWGRYLNKTFTHERKGRADTELGFYAGRHHDNAPFDGPGEVLAHAFFPIFGGDIHFDENERWTSNQTDGVNFKEVVIHEVGHSIGLRHSNDINAVMHSMYKNNAAITELTRDDLKAIRWLYRRVLR